MVVANQALHENTKVRGAGWGGGGVTPIDPVLPPATGVKTLVKWKLEQSKGQGKVKRVKIGPKVDIDMRYLLT